MDGRAPSLQGSLQRKSLLGVKESPIEYLWKWNSPRGKPDVQYTTEAVGPATGTALAPLHQQAATLEMLHNIASLVPSMDLSWTNHFVATLDDPGRTKDAQEAPAAGGHLMTTIMVAAKWIAAGLTLKTYFIPQHLGQTNRELSLAWWEESLTKLHPRSPARTAMNEFLATNPEGKLLRPL